MFKRSVLVSLIKGNERFIKLGESELNQKAAELALAWVKNVLSAEGKSYDGVVFDSQKQLSECGAGYVLKQANDKTVEIWFNRECDNGWVLSNKFIESEKIGSFFVKEIEEIDDMAKSLSTRLETAETLNDAQVKYINSLRAEISELEEAKVELRDELANYKKSSSYNKPLPPTPDRAPCNFDAVVTELKEKLLLRHRSAPIDINFENTPRLREIEPRNCMEHDVSSESDDGLGVFDTYDNDAQDSTEENPHVKLRRLLSLSC